MSKTALIALAAATAPRIFQIRKRTWISLAVGVFVLMGLMVWAIVALLSWAFSNAGAVISHAPDAAKRAQEQAEVFMPGIRKTIEDLVPGLSIFKEEKTEPASEKSAPTRPD